VSRHSCKTLGHIVVGQDVECLVCGKWVTPEDRIARHINRPHDELADPRGVATTEEWGPLG